MTSGLLLTHKTNITMTREAFIRKWCCTGYGYTEEKRDEMRDDLDDVVYWVNSLNQNNKPLVIANVSGQSEQLPQLCQCTMKHEDCECAFYNECSECGLPLR